MHQVPMVDSLIRCDDECPIENYILVVRDTLSVPNMDHNLIPSFSMREAGINVRTELKFQM